MTAGANIVRIGRFLMPGLAAYTKGKRIVFPFFGLTFISQKIKIRAQAHSVWATGADSGVEEEDSVRYQEPLMFRMAEGLASPACMDGSGAGAGSSGCQMGDIFVESGPEADCANGNEDNYCLDGFYIPPTGFTDQCSLGALPITNTLRCSTGSGPT